MRDRPSDGRSLRGRTGLLLALLLLCPVALAGCGSGEGDDSQAGVENSGGGGGDDGRTAMIERVTRSVVAVTAFPHGENRDPEKGARHSHGSGFVWKADKGL